MIDEKKFVEDLQMYFVNNRIHKNDLGEVISKQPKLENTEDFKHFTMYSDSTLKSMRKDDLIDYIHTIYFYWKNCDIQLENKIKINNRLYNKLVKIHKNPPLKFEELKLEIPYWDNKVKCWCWFETLNEDIKTGVVIHIKDVPLMSAFRFEENRFYRYEVK